jgi:NADH-quinone oxidoreductase subunit G
VLVGERAAAVPGALSAALQVASATGARLAWVPRRAGERGAVEAGTLPGLLPGGRLVADAEARVDLAAAWGAGSLPAEPGRDVTAILEAAASGGLGALLVGGVDPDDLPDPVLAHRALEAVPFLVSLEVRRSAVTEHADVVLPVAPVAEKAGTFLDWEGRPRPFDAVLDSRAMSDLRVLHALADQLDVELGFRGPADARAELTELGGWEAAGAAAPQVPATEPPEPGPGEAVLATWDLLLGTSRLQDGEPFLAGTAHRAHARLSPGTAAAVGVVDGGTLAVSTDAGTLTVPVLLTEMPDHAVWLPSGSRGSDVRRVLRAAHGHLVRLAPGGHGPVPTGASAVHGSAAPTRSEA